MNTTPLPVDHVDVVDHEREQLLDAIDAAFSAGALRTVETLMDRFVEQYPGDGALVEAMLR